MINLVKNAIKFTNQGEVSIRACYRPEPENLIIVHVQDTGVGVTESELPKLFNKFGKLQRTAAMNHDGIGLGLTIVKQIVEKGKGAVGIESDGVNRGSLFCISMHIDPVEEVKSYEQAN